MTTARRIQMVPPSKFILISGLNSNDISRWCEVGPGHAYTSHPFVCLCMHGNSVSVMTTQIIHEVDFSKWTPTSGWNPDNISRRYEVDPGPFYLHAFVHLLTLPTRRQVKGPGRFPAPNSPKLVFEISMTFRGDVKWAWGMSIFYILNLHVFAHAATRSTRQRLKESKGLTSPNSSPLVVQIPTTFQGDTKWVQSMSIFYIHLWT